ncbi:MAG TPA: sensor histidine kinase [Pseudolysinimonas sp.]|nr:sensor histidine kinase [Pseudolysinimonas sp.]
MRALSRWWDLGIAVTVAGSLLIVALTLPDASDWIVAGTALLVLVLGWIAAGRRAAEGDARSVVFSVVLVVGTGALVAVNPILAIAQTIAYPMVWMLAGTTRIAVAFNVAIAGAVAAGFLVSTGTGPSSLISTGITVVLSLVFSLALGLWITSIARLSEERRSLLDTLTAAQDELAVLHRDSGITSERERLARELHDTIAQSLAGLVLLGQRSRRELAAGTLTDDTLELIESGARGALAETRSLVAGSAPVELNAGIAAALARLGERFRRETGIDVTTQSSVDSAAALGRDSEVVLLRCAQEGLANVRKHAGAHSAHLELTVDAGTAVLRITDDGHGFDPAAATSGFGLSGLRDRLGLVGGSIAIDGTAGATTLTARLPLAEVAA